MTLQTTLCGVPLDNPTILASGILGVTQASMRYAAENGAGAVTMKSITKEPRKGHNNPILISYEAGCLNAVGYSNPGWEVAREEFKNLDLPVPAIGSVTAGSPDEFAFMVENFADSLGFPIIELPLSCPHTPGFGTLAGQGTPEATEAIMGAVRDKTKKPVIIKVSPSSQELGRLSKAAEDAGANAICAGNTMGPGMVINIESGKPILDFKVGGVSGPALKPIAVRCVYDIYENIEIPIIGTGGVSTGRDAVEMFMAGASAVGIGTAVHYRGIDVFKKVCTEIEEFMEANGYSKVSDMVGVAHE